MHPKPDVSSAAAISSGAPGDTERQQQAGLVGTDEPSPVSDRPQSAQAQQRIAALEAQLRDLRSREEIEKQTAKEALDELRERLTAQIDQLREEKDRFRTKLNLAERELIEWAETTRALRREISINVVVGVIVVAAVAGVLWYVKN